MDVHSWMRPGCGRVVVGTFLLMPCNAMLVDLDLVAKACRSRDYSIPKALFAFRSYVRAASFQNRCIGRIRATAPGPGRTSSDVATTNATCKGNRLRVSFDERVGKETALRFQFRGRPSASGCKESRSAYRGRPKVRTSQSSPLTQQLASEQGESRTQDRAGNLATRKDSNDARSVYAR